MTEQNKMARCDGGYIATTGEPEVNELFENITPGKQLVAPKPPKPKNRMEYYDNGPEPKPPVTQYGLLWDIGHSTQRCNLNFGILDVNWIADNCDSAQLTSDEQAHITAVGLYYMETVADTNALVTFGKWNGLSGTGAHNLRKGMQGMYFGTAAILQLGHGSAPTVHLYHNGGWTTLNANWKPAPYASNPAKLWQVKF